MSIAMLAGLALLASNGSYPIFGGPFSDADIGLWAATPSPEQRAAAMAGLDIPLRKGAEVEFDCKVGANGALLACAPTSADPKGMGQTLQPIANAFTLAPRRGEQPSHLQLLVHVLASQRALGASPAPGRDLDWDDVDWIDGPTQDVVGQFYPNRALRLDRGGSVGVRCRIDTDGSLRLCTATSDSNPGFDFPLAALRISGLLRAKAKTKAGEPTAGRFLAMTYRFGIGAPPTGAPYPNRFPNLVPDRAPFGTPSVGRRGLR